MNKKLLFKAFSRLIAGIIIVFILLFIPAGSFHYYNGWIFMGLLFIPMFIAGLIMFFKNPKLLELRLNAREQEKNQKIVLLLSGIMFILGFLLAGFNYRFNWNCIQNNIVLIASIIFVISYILYAEVLRENTYLSRTVEVLEDQQIVDKGLYGIIRHPMYLITILLFLSMPIILGSIYSFFVFLFYPIIIITRINNEEKVLENNLKGYKNYKKKVKYRLIPYIW